ncbi:hypothetical protein VKA52_18345 [Halobacillus sp. HZG1]|uniref:hypothetical protein n=1 Tax=Halobacillus sp. HZG1 TaxID=3111769 RepID=UPI002DB8800C|nr:hypothetical protein [Halobacillus sp. HZG1]MEC3885686.1 hypothetical protein [Halobacillus sp. HZG1]
MYRIIRQIDNDKETLKNSSSSTTKYIHDYEEAVLLKNQLNTNSSSPHYEWIVEKVD